MRFLSLLALAFLIVAVGCTSEQKEEAADAMNDAKEAAGDVAEKAGEVAEDAKDAAEDAGDAVGDVVDEAGEAVGDVAENVAEGAEAAVDKAGDAANAIGDKMEGAADAAKGAIDGAADAAKSIAPVSLAGTTGCGHCDFHIGDSCSAAMKTADGTIYILDGVDPESKLFTDRQNAMNVKVVGVVKDGADGAKHVAVASSEIM